MVPAKPARGDNKLDLSSGSYDADSRLDMLGSGPAEFRWGTHG